MGLHGICNRGAVVPIDFDAPINTIINWGTVHRELSAWPGQKDVGFLLDGAQFRAGLPL